MWKDHQWDESLKIDQKSDLFLSSSFFTLDLSSSPLPFHSFHPHPHPCPPHLSPHSPPLRLTSSPPHLLPPTTDTSTISFRPHAVFTKKFKVHLGAACQVPINRQKVSRPTSHRLSVRHGPSRLLRVHVCFPCHHFPLWSVKLFILPDFFIVNRVSSFYEVAMEA